MSTDFLEKAKAMGKIKNVEEAFNKYPVNEEWHKGRADLFVEETKEIYDEYQIGDIIFVDKYKYPNGVEGSNHLFVIIDKNIEAVPIEYFGMIFSSKIDKQNYDMNELIRKTIENGLSKDSIVKKDEAYKISKEQILFKIGRIELDIVNRWKDEFLNNV